MSTSCLSEEALVRDNSAVTWRGNSGFSPPAHIFIDQNAELHCFYFYFSPQSLKQETEATNHKEETGGVLESSQATVKSAKIFSWLQQLLNEITY